MAIARRAVGTVATSNGVSNMLPGIPAGNAANDILVMVATVGGSVTTTMPAGWTQKISRANGANHKLEVWWKRAVGGETSPSVAFSAATDAVGRIVSYSGCVTSGDPFNAFDSQANASSATGTSPAITPTVTNSMILFVGGWSTTGSGTPTSSGYSGTNPAFTESIDNTFSAGTFNTAVCAADGLSTSTSSLGTRTCTWTAADVNSAGMLALSEATSGVTVALSGSAISYSAGTLAPSNDLALAGSQYTYSGGTLTASTGGNLTLALTGALVGYSAGTLAPSSTLTLTGSAESYSAGTLGVSHAQPLAGLAEAYSTGVLTPATTVSVAGSLASYSTGTLGVQAGGDITLALTGASFAFNAGTLTALGGDVASSVTPAGRGGASGSNRKRYLVQIDGQDFTVTSETQAVELLQRARAVAERIVERKATNVEKRLRRRDVVPAITLATPEITVPFELREATAPLIADIERLYAKASVEMELRLLLAREQEADEDDDDVLLLI
jgi:hypothetical protein